MKITDAHAHISDTVYGNVGLYLEQIKEAGIAEGVVVPGGMLDVRKMTDYITGRAQPENPVPDNSYVQQSCKAHQESLWGLICVDPHDDNALENLENGLKSGYRGLKLSPMSHQFSFAAKAVANLAACCGEYGFPVYTHVVYSPGAATARFVTLARQFPKTNFILGHMGFGPADVEGLEAAAVLDNLYLETSTGNFLHLQESVKRAGAGKIVYGSEFPLSHPKAELEKILLLKLPASDREKILGGNIRTLLGIS
ncbi:amidohydrolase family protein [Phosphitispora fastidiosa]|uniref:amidohydrolase family protein n=1 Tax=Phosphitispora fastidiosa TaxID=2837202 RepID=UPI001E30A0C5|nr:amidohydrolase family protein [Phosphitispora fastidiosa]MBU7007095.1 putative TIM-barrel fold metal-dependent hydrolase [Phosphitispora fastidiosa]